MSELCCKFQIPALNTLGEDAETRTVLQCDIVQNMYDIQGGVFLIRNSLFLMHMSSAYLNCVFKSFKSLHQILKEKLWRHNLNYSVICSKYVSHSGGYNSTIMSWIKILFPLCICSMQV